jgi:hypothetical protein
MHIITDLREAVRIGGAAPGIGKRPAQKQVGECVMF